MLATGSSMELSYHCAALTKTSEIMASIIAEVAHLWSILCRYFRKKTTIWCGHWPGDQWDRVYVDRDARLWDLVWRKGIAHLYAFFIWKRIYLCCRYRCFSESYFIVSFHSQCIFLFPSVENCIVFIVFTIVSYTGLGCMQWSKCFSFNNSAIDIYSFSTTTLYTVIICINIVVIGSIKLGFCISDGLSLYSVPSVINQTVYQYFVIRSCIK